MGKKMRYRLALDLGMTSIGWCVLRLDNQDPPEPIAVTRMGARIFPSGREAAPPGQQGDSLAKTRRERRQARRRRDRMLRRRERLIQALVHHGFFPVDAAKRAALSSLDPYVLRRKGLREALMPEEFGRVVFHLNQRRGFKSNRKTDTRDPESGALKTAVSKLREALKGQTVGEWLARRHDRREGVRARFHQVRVPRDDGKTRIEKFYDLYIDRQMIEEEFDALWAKQSSLNPIVFTDTARLELKGVLLFQRPLKPVRPGRCTLMPHLERAPLALPSVQLFRIYQEVNNLCLLESDLSERAMTLEQRDLIANDLATRSRSTFERLKKKINVGGTARFNLEDAKRLDLKGNTTAAVLADEKHYGPTWHRLSLAEQDQIVERLLNEEDASVLLRWLQAKTGIDEPRAERIANAKLPDGYGSVSRDAVALVLPHLQREVIPFSKAVELAAKEGAPFDHHSAISHAEGTGEILELLPYYGEYLQRHVGFGSREEKDRGSPEAYFGRIANPTVHIGLNEVRKVVNALIKRYGCPVEVVVEVARELKQGRERRVEILRDQAQRQKQNERWAQTLTDPSGDVRLQKVSTLDLQRMKLWEELSSNPLDRKCPYTGEQISLARLFSPEVEIEHILPFNRTLDDSLNNKTVALRRANRVKGNLTPWEAFGAGRAAGYDYDAIMDRAKLMPRDKAKRFAPDGYQRWLREDKDFIARALNDTAYLSRVAREYLSLVCPPNKVRVIPGRLTSLLRAKFGLNSILGVSGEKNRNDHRHHAVDAAVIGVTDQGLLQRFAQASATAREAGLERLVGQMPLPWPTFVEHVSRAVDQIKVSFKPDHSHEARLHNETAYGLLGDGMVAYTKLVDGRRVREPEKLSVIEMIEPKALQRHGTLPDGSPRPYKGYKGDSNYCIEIVRGNSGRWEGDVVSTFEAYQVVRSGGPAKLRDPRIGIRGKPLVMRLMIDDVVRLEVDGQLRLMRVAKISGNGQVFMADHHEANVDARNRDKADDFKYVSKMAGSFKSAKARRVSVSPIGELNDPGFQD